MIRSYDNLTIKQFLQCKLIAELEKDPVTRKMKMYAEVSGKTLEEVEAMPIGDLVAGLKSLDSIDTLTTDSKVNMKFKLGGKRWIIKWRQQDLTGEQYIDSTFFCKDETKLIQNIHNILASLAVERGWFKELPYSGETHKERADLFYNHMKIKDAYPIMLFFCEYFKTLADNIQIYLVTEAEKVTREVREHLEKNGVGLQS
jgi:hypothetical protein